MKRIKTVRPKYQRRFTAVRWGIFLIMIFAFFIFMCTGNFIKPVLLIPMALCISVNEDELVSACTGVLCGLLTDIACGRLFGYNAIILAVSCTAVSLLFSNLLRRSWINVFLLSSATTFIHGLIDYSLYYLIWSSEDVSIIYSDIIFPSCIITSLSSIAIYYAVRAVRHRFTPERLQPLIDL